MNDEEYMQLAYQQACFARDIDEVPIGAIIVKDGEIIATGYNQKESQYDVTAHAEMIAITAATQAMGGKYLENCTLYVTVEPCSMCASALCWAHVGEIVYGADDPKRGYSLFTPSLLHPRTKVRKGVMAAECGRIVSDFFRGKREQA